MVETQIGSRPFTKAEVAKRWRVRHPEEYKKQGQEYRSRHKVKLRERNKAWWDSNKDYHYKRVNTKEGWAKIKIGSIRAAAKVRGKECTLTLQDILELVCEKCPVLGIPLNYTHPKSGKILSIDSPSLDRIDNSKGYTKDNVVLVSNLANKIKGELSLQEIPVVLTKIIDFYAKYK